MSSYKLTAIYKQKIRCRLRSSNCPSFCLCQNCWVLHKRQQVMKSHTNIMRNVPPPPPLPNLNIKFGLEVNVIPGPILSSDIVLFDANKVVNEDEIKELWFNRIILPNAANTTDMPKDFVFVHLDPILQIGPNCGLVALAMVTITTPTPVSTIELYRRAKQRGFTYQGEMFSAENMASLAQTVLRPWFKVELISGGLNSKLTYVLDCLRKGALMLVPYDASGNFSPCCKRGHKSHWAVVCGAANAGSLQTDDCYVFVRQGKSRRLLLWPFRELQISNDNLLEFDPNRAQDGSQYVLPEGGVQAGLMGRAIILHMLHKKPDLIAFP